MEFFVTIQFLSGLLIGAVFGVMGGMLLGLILLPPIARDLLGEDDVLHAWPAPWHEDKGRTPVLSAAGVGGAPGGRDRGTGPEARPIAREAAFGAGGTQQPATTGGRETPAAAPPVQPPTSQPTDANR
jgi:hypothetical protein